MRRLALISAALVAVVVAAIVLLNGSSATGGGDPYQVRAIFDDAASAVPGEDVRIAGAPVGTISSLDVCIPHKTSCPPGTANKAAVTLEIDKPGFTPFHTNAFCAIRPQSLIGEKYVDCSPGTARAPTLSRITSGPGSGSYYLPVTNTSSPVDTDIVQDIYRQPVRQALAIILNELGTGLAARGSDLNAVIHRANPALAHTDQVLKILAQQNRQLAQLATDADAVLTPLARDRHEIADFVLQANTTSIASAARAADIRRSIHLLPSFLRQLRPLMADLGGLADQGTPLFSSLNRSAGSLAQEFVNLAPFAGVARSSLIALGASAAQQQPALLATIQKPALLLQRLRKLGNAGVPSFSSLDRLTRSLDRTGGIERLMELLFYGTAATNGFDSVGHYVRDQVLVGDCTGYAKTPVSGCSANFSHTKGASDAAAAAPPQGSALTGLVRYLIGTGQ